MQQSGPITISYYHCTVVLKKTAPRQTYKCHTVHSSALSFFLVSWSLCFCFLSNIARKKATYDKFGEEGLKGGIPSELGVNGAWSSGYVYHGNADETFRQFFGGDNPFAGYFYRMKKLYCCFFNE